MCDEDYEIPEIDVRELCSDEEIAKFFIVNMITPDGYAS